VLWALASELAEAQGIADAKSRHPSTRAWTVADEMSGAIGWLLIVGVLSLGALAALIGSARGAGVVGPFLIGAGCVSPGAGLAS
jgi:hypothetical protein